MNFVYELLRAGTTQSKKVQEKFAEVDKSIQEGVAADVPIGDETTAGIVKSSNSENKVSINKDGTMEVVSLNVNKLKQDNGDYIILDGNV